MNVLNCYDIPFILIITDLDYLRSCVCRRNVLPIGNTLSAIHKNLNFTTFLKKAIYIIDLS